MKSSNLQATNFPDPSTCTPPLQQSPRGGWDLEIPMSELPKPLDFSAIFGRSAPVEVEIGVGSGVYLSLEAQRRPEWNFLGVEKVAKEVRRAKDKWRRRGLLNTRIVQSDAHYFLEEYPPDASIDRYSILFSDPWPKKRHHKRRLFQPRLVPIIERTLRPGGLLYIKTDVTSYFEVIRGLLDPAPFLSLEREHRLDREPLADDIVTNFQAKAIEKGHPIHLVEYRRL